MKESNDAEIVRLEKFEANSFMGIDKSRPIIIDFSEKRKNQNIMELTGDQGVCKTSTLCAILYAMGGTLGVERKRLFNIKDKDIDAGLEFTYSGDKYKVAVGPDRVVLRKYYPEKDKWKVEDEPMSTLRTIFGPVGLSPFSVREMKGKAQVKFFMDMFGGGEEASKKELKLEQDIEKLVEQRKDLNKDIKNVKGALEIEPMYQAYEKTQAKFKTIPTAAKEKARMDELQIRKAEYDKAKSGMDVLGSQRTAYQNNITDLERRLLEEKNKLAAVNKRIEEGSAYLKTNAGIETEYEEANEDWLNISKTLAEYEKWKGIVKKKKELDEWEDASTKATGKIDRLRLDQLELVNSYIPKVKGLKAEVKRGLDKEIEKEGVYYNGINIAQISESEYISLWCAIWEAMDMGFIFLENSTSLGSSTVNVLNELAKNGAVIIGTRLVRKQKDIEWQFITKID